MSLIKTGGGVTDIRGGFGGVSFTRDKSGLHCSSKPRRVHQITDAQRKQRNAFIKARTYTKDPRWVSYYIYLALNNIPFPFDAIVTGDPDPDCRDTYVLDGTFAGKDFYKRKDEAFFIWYYIEGDSWHISPTPGTMALDRWYRLYEIEGVYKPYKDYDGNPVVKIELRPPPTDYQIPRL